MDTVKDLVAAFRDDEKDIKAPYFWSDSQLVRWSRQAVDRFCEITRSVYDSTSAFTTIDVLVGDSVFPRHPSIIDIASASIEGQNGRELEIQAPGSTPRSCLPTSGRTRLMVIDNANFRLYPAAPEPFTLQLEVLRRSLRPLEMDSRLTDVPADQREHLLLYLKHRAYRVNDAEMFDPARSADFLAEFEQACQTYYEVAGRARSPRNIKFSW